MNSRRGQVRILQVVGAMNRAGVETWLMHVLRNVDRRRYRMDFLIHTERAGAYDDEIRELGSDLIRCPDAHNPLIYSWQFHRAMQKHGPYHIIHSHIHHYSGFVLKLADREGIPMRVVHSHCDTAVTQSGVGPLRRAYLSTSMRWINRHATLGLAVSSDSARDLFGAGWESDPRWSIFRLGFDFSPFQSGADCASVRSELGIPEGAFVVGHVGRFDEQKNHSFLTEIASELIRVEPRTHVLLIGDGHLRPFVVSKLSEKGIADRVMLLGSRPDVPALMLGAMDVLVFPSLFEGLPVVLIEAQAAGLPCVISDVITDEGDVVGPLIRRLSLSRSASDWAEAVLHAGRCTDRPAQQWHALARMEQSPFDIRMSMSELTRIYDGVQNG